MTKKIKKVLKNLLNPNDQLIAVDLDGTLCKGEFWGEEEPKPIQEMIDYIWKLYVGGAHIIIYTARQIKYTAETYAWLDKHGVPYHGLMMNRKPGADVYIDDKAINVDYIEVITKNNDIAEETTIEEFSEPQLYCDDISCNTTDPYGRHIRFWKK